MSTSNGHGAVFYQASGVLMQRNGTTIEQAIASLYAQADATGLDVVAVAAAVVRSVTAKDADEN
jgi:AmiR/NasT family two-component response regulator